MKFNVIQPHTCGSCTLCCKVLAIRELEKPKDAWCQHAVKGKGCGVYVDRPPSCQIFECVWLSQHLQVDFRPDKIHGVIIGADSGIGAEGMAIHEDPGYPGVASYHLRHVIKAFLDKDMTRYVVVITGKHRRFLGHPDLIKRMFIEEDQENPDIWKIMIDTAEEQE